jgi:hypothetical protein
MTIGNGNTPITSHSALFKATEADSLETGVAGKATPGAAARVAKGVLAALATNFASRAAGVSTDGMPALTPSKEGLSDNVEVKSALNLEIGRLESDPAYAAAVGAFFMQLEKDCLTSIDATVNAQAKAPAKSNDDFDINNMKSFAPVELIMLLLHLLSTLRNTDAALNAKMTLGAAASVGNTVDALKQQGYDQMVGAIAGAAVGFGLSAAGAAMGAVASKRTFQNANQNGAAIDRSKAETAKLSTALDSAKSGKPGAELKELKVKQPGADGEKTANIESSNKTLDAADKKVIEEKIEGDQPGILSERREANAHNEFNISKWQAGSGLANALGVGVSGMAAGVTHNAVMEGRVEEQVTGLNTKMFNETSQQAQSRTDALNAKVGDVLAMAKQIQEAIAAGRNTQAAGTRV